MNALNGKPLKAFIYQDHDAHMAAHQAFLQDPMVAQLIGKTHRRSESWHALQAHLIEHLGFKYRKQMEEKMGAPLPNPNAELSENMEVNLSSCDAHRQGASDATEPAAGCTTASPARGTRPCGADATGRTTDQAARSAA